MSKKDQAKAQAIYMQYIVRKANEKARKNEEALAFDPQGRVLIDVKLEDSDFEKIVQEINAHTTSETYSQDKKSLEAAVGRELTSVTTVSLDISADSRLSKKFNKAVKDNLCTFFKEAYRDTSNTKINQVEKIADKFKALQPKGSIIALQQEFHFHLALTGRVYQKAIPALKAKEEEIQAAHQKTMLIVNQFVMLALARGLESIQDEDWSIAKLNKILDKSRKAIMPEAHDIFLEKIAESTGVRVTKNDLEASNIPLKKIAETTTATDNDILHTEHNGLAVLIAGSEDTSHGRVPGTKFAHRQIITHFIVEDKPTEELKITANEEAGLRIRTPSPVIKKDKPVVKKDKPKNYVADVKEKLTSITEQYHLRTRLKSCEERGNVTFKKPKAFIYNSYTAINDTLDDWITNNRQTQSAMHILQGAHLHNASQRKENDPVLCLVQNISVNGFGDHLSYTSNNLLVRESTLMAEIAMLHTISDIVTDEEQLIAINYVFRLYEQYLDEQYPRKGSPDLLFSDSKKGEEAIEIIRKLKKNWQLDNKAKDSDSSGLDSSLQQFNQKELKEKAKHILKNMMTFDLHWRHDYAKLVQTLSVFTEEASIGGCKSGNERAQAINGRVAILDKLSIHEKKLGNKFQTLSQLIKFADCNSTGDWKEASPEERATIVENNARHLRKLIDKTFNGEGLQSAASVISLVDQGGSAKVEAKPALYFSRNYAEESSDIMTNLFQTNTSAMQAHKGLTKAIFKAIGGNPETWWSRMKSTCGGIVGAILGIITIVPALWIAISNPRDNEKSRKKAEDKLLKAANKYLPKKIPVISPSLTTFTRGGITNKNVELSSPITRVETNPSSTIVTKTVKTNPSSTIVTESFPQTEENQSPNNKY